jgi:arsenate reductase
MSAVTVRQSEASDRAAILALLQQASLPIDDLVEPGRVRFWAAVRDGKIVGAVGLETFGTSGYLRSLVVAADERSQGTGVALVRALERDAAAGGLREMALLTQTAQLFFARLDYRVIPREQAPEAVRVHPQFQSLCPASAVCMIKALPAPVQVLFLCTGNSCRSILGEATFNHLAPEGWRAMSAGSKPTGRVHPRSLALLKREGIRVDGYHSKSWDDLPVTPDVVITVCASAAGESCPAYLGPVLRAHWGVDDPAHATGTDAEIDAAFDAAYRTLRRRIEALLALPLDALVRDRTRLQSELARIGATVS